MCSHTRGKMGGYRMPIDSTTGNLCLPRAIGCVTIL